MRLTYLLFPILFFSQTLFSQALFSEFSMEIYGGNSNTKSSNVDIALHDYDPIITASLPINGSSNIYGTRAVGWFGYAPWLGMGAELYTFKAESETVEISPLVLSTTIMFRYPHKIWKPYITLGLSSSSCDIDISREAGLGVKISETTNNSYGWDFSTGILWSVDRHVSLFAEYRYTAISIDFGDEKFYESNTKISSNLKSTHSIFGLSFRF